MRLTDGAVRILTEYAWPGNVRELANAMERAAILSRDRSTLTSETLSFLRLDGPGEACSPPGAFSLPPGGISLEALERDLVRQAMAASGDNQTAAADLLGLTRSKFRVLLKHVEASE
jgi:DNA-binding NtrC family response regulator